MTFANAVNGSNNDFQVTSGIMEWATRDRYVYGRTENLGISYSGSTFSITSGDGSALSTTNPGYVTLNSGTAGRLVRAKVTANQTFVDSTGSSTIIGNLFGLTTGIAYTADLPFFIYAVLDNTDANVAFMVSRYPNITLSPVAAKIGQSGSAIADTQGSMFSLKAITAANYASTPAVAIGSFRMRMNASDDWAVQSLTSNDGMGRFQEGNAFTMSAGQFGAASGKYFLDNGGTAPSFSTNNISWQIDRFNRLFFFGNFSNATAGVGAVNCKFALPYSLVACFGSLYLNNGAGPFNGQFIGDAGPTNTNTFLIGNDATTLILLNNNVTTNAGYIMNFNPWGICNYS